MPTSPHKSYQNGYARPPTRLFNTESSLQDDLLYWVALIRRLLLSFWNAKGRRGATSLIFGTAYQIRRNLTIARLLSFPHLLLVIWVFILLWGERWVFESRVEHCDWDRWEQWPKGSTPHHLILVADPQLIDPHSYPGRPWPINPLTVMITDNYMRRSYTNLQKILHPDTTIFLGDLFDGGREWNTAHGGFDDPEWARPHPANEAKYVKMWNKKYGEDFWLKEYARFGDMFFKPFNIGGPIANEWQRGRKIIASLPGNHDLGFGAQVKVSVRDRFRAYFGEENRIDVIGNHTVVSVDTVSLAAGTSDAGNTHNLEYLYKPAEIFLDEVQRGKRQAVEKELRFWRGEIEDDVFKHTVQDMDHADFSDNRPEAEVAELPTILLTHVPLYRAPGTSCGPLREHWPPTKPPAGQTEPVFPDHRNAISVSAGYQYQNVLSEEDSIKLVKKIGNVKHVFSGDDHDYCELTHNDAKENVKEITVKSISMAMGVPTPGFLMVSLWNPVDPNTGKPLAAVSDRGGHQATMQTHLCLLPNQLGTFGRYATFGFLTILALAVRAVLVPVMGWRPFALEPVPVWGKGNPLPMYKDKVEEPQSRYHYHHTGTDGGFLSSGRFAGSAPESRTRSAPLANPHGSTAHVKGASYAQQPLNRSSSKGNKTKPRDGKWSWATRGPKIEIGTEDELIRMPEGTWKVARRPVRGGREILRVAVRELLTGLWRVLWVAGAMWAWLNYRG